MYLIKIISLRQNTAANTVEVFYKCLIQKCVLRVIHIVLLYTQYFKNKNIILKKCPTL